MLADSQNRCAHPLRPPFHIRRCYLCSRHVARANCAESNYVDFVGARATIGICRGAPRARGIGRGDGPRVWTHSRSRLSGVVSRSFERVEGELL
jgi:hypothetical protein